jgi:hypothetical protein
MAANGLTYVSSLAGDAYVKASNVDLKTEPVRLLKSTRDFLRALWGIAALRNALTSVLVGLLVTMYGWFMLYWDSYIPGSFPRSPQWPWKYRSVPLHLLSQWIFQQLTNTYNFFFILSSNEGHSLTLNQIIVILLGPIAALQTFRELGGGWIFA